MRTHYALDSFDAVKRCHNLNSNVCKFFELKGCPVGKHYEFSIYDEIRVSN